MTLAGLDHVAGAILEALWRSSWQASVLAALVLLAQALLRRKTPARWRYNLWAIVVIRLLVPITPPSPFSLFNLTGHLQASTPAEHLEAPSTVSIPLAPILTSNAESRASAHDVVMSTKANPQAPTMRWRSILVSIWIAGAFVMLARIVLATVRLSRAVRRMEVVDDALIGALLDRCRTELGVHRHVEMRSSPDLGAPALMGVFRPRLLLPARVLRDFPPAELRLILLHELGHQKRRDVAANWLLAILQSIHWFNPAIWLVFARLRADRELACDELVLTSASDGENKTYGHTLVKLLQKLPRPDSRSHERMVPAMAAVGILEYAHTMRRRIIMITQFARQRSPLRTWIAIVCLIVLGGIGLTDRVRGDAKPVNERASDRARAKAPPAATPATRNTVNRTWTVVSPPGGSILFEKYDPNTYSIRLEAPPTTQPVADAERTYARFQRRLPEIKFDAIPFMDGLDFLRDTADLNIVVNSRALEAAGIDMNIPLTIRLKNVTLEQALRQILQQVGGGTVALAFGVQGNGIVISTEDDVPTRVRAYDVSDLLGVATTRPDDKMASANSLVQIIEQDVAHDSWRDQGGTIGSIGVFGQRLVISTTDMNHLEIDHLLSELRMTKVQSSSR